MFDGFYFWTKVLLIYGIIHTLAIKIPTLRRHVAYHNRRLGEVLDGEMTLYRINENPGTEKHALRKGYGGSQLTKLVKNTSRSGYFQEQLTAAYIWEAMEWVKTFGNIIALIAFSEKFWPVLAYPVYGIAATADAYQFGRLMLLMMTDEDEKGTGLTFLAFMLTHGIELVLFGIMVYSFPWASW